MLGGQSDRGRWLLTTLGRWASPAPIGFAGGDVNPCRYVFNVAVTHCHTSAYKKEATRRGKRVAWGIIDGMLGGKGERSRT